MTDPVIVAMKWGDLYASDYVNVLFNACTDFMTGPFRFVCFTDDAAGIDPRVECLEIPDIGLDERHFGYGAWPKIAVLDHMLYDLQGRALFIDLDTVVCGSLDEMFSVEGDFVALDSRPWKSGTGPARTGTGIFAYTIGTLGWVVDKLRAERDAMFEAHGIEQDYLHAVLPKITYWPDPWIRSFKYHQRQPLGWDRFRGPNPPEAPAKILCFHGKPRPIDLIRPPSGNWDRFPHYGRGQVDWMVDYWTRYGGTV